MEHYNKQFKKFRNSIRNLSKEEFEALNSIGLEKSSRRGSKNVSGNLSAYEESKNDIDNDNYDEIKSDINFTTTANL